MMHNSLLIQERLLETNQNALHRSRRDPHKFVKKLDPSLHAASDEIEWNGTWQVTGAAESPAVQEAVQDLHHFLKKFGIVTTTGEAADHRIQFALDSQVSDGSFRRTVTAETIEIAAKDSKGIWAGLIDLEKELSMRGGPLLPLGIVSRAPAWKVHMSQAPFGSNYLVPDLSEPYLSDDAFRMLAHYGINGMTIYGDWLLYVNSRIFPELNCEDYQRNITILRETSERADRFGISLYFVPVSPKLLVDHPLFQRMPSARGAKINPGISLKPKEIHNLCTSDPDVLAFHAETMENLFREVPLLGGLNLIIGGESYYHCYMRPDRRGLPQGQKTNCPRCSASSPETVVAGLLKVTADAVHKVKSTAPVMAWPYSAFAWSSDPAQLEFTETIDEQVALLTTIDKDQWAQKEGYKKLIWDYSIDYTGPADNIMKQAEILKERNMELYVKTETALGLEFIQFPYIPCLQRISKKWGNVKMLSPAGVLQSWMFFGMWGSRAEELGWWSSWHPEWSAETVIAKIAQRDFGPLAPKLIKVWDQMSEAVGHLPYIPSYFTGPEFIGPAHPLYIADHLKDRERFEALLYYLQENEETFSTTVNEVKHLLVMERIPHERMKGVMKVDVGNDYWSLFIREYAKAREHAKHAWDLIKDLESSGDAVENETLQEEKWLCELIYRTIETTWNTYTFLNLKAAYIEQRDQSTIHQLVKIMEREVENAKQAKPIYERAPWFDLSLRVDGNYPSSIQMINSKIATMEEEIKWMKTHT